GENVVRQFGQIIRQARLRNHQRHVELLLDCPFVTEQHTVAALFAVLTEPIETIVSEVDVAQVFLQHHVVDEHAVVGHEKHSAFPPCPPRRENSGENPTFVLASSRQGGKFPNYLAFET